MRNIFNQIKVNLGPILLITILFSFLIITHIRVVINHTSNLLYEDTLYMTKIVYVDTNNLFNEAINHLKEYEGFRSEMYYDVDGSKTIGYGHHFNSNESFSTITEEEATILLIKDLNKKIEFVEGHTDLRGNKSLALGLFAYNVGTGNLMKAINKGLLTNINRITDYCHYSTIEDGQKITKRSDQLYERRKFELYLYTID